MIIGNKKPLVVIGYLESSMTDEFVQAINETSSCEVIKPLDFYSITKKSKYQYIVSITFDWAERLEIIDFLEKEGLDLFTFIHDTCVIGNKPAPVIGSGSFIFPHVIISLAAKVGKNCIIGPQSIIGHRSALGDNCLLRPRVMIVNGSTVGKNCICDLGSTVYNKAKITDNVEIYPFTRVRKNIQKSGKYFGYPLKNITNSKK